MFEFIVWLLAIFAAMLFAVWLFGTLERRYKADRRRETSIKEWDEHCKEFERKRKEDSK